MANHDNPVYEPSFWRPPDYTGPKIAMEGKPQFCSDLLMSCAPDLRKRASFRVGLSFNFSKVRRNNVLSQPDSPVAISRFQVAAVVLLLEDNYHTPPTFPNHGMQREGSEQISDMR